MFLTTTARSRLHPELEVSGLRRLVNRRHHVIEPRSDMSVRIESLPESLVEIIVRAEKRFF